MEMEMETQDGMENGLKVPPKLGAAAGTWTLPGRITSQHAGSGVEEDVMCRGRPQKKRRL